LLLFYFLNHTLLQRDMEKGFMHPGIRKLYPQSPAFPPR
jgi:hypothetical protein